MIGPSLASRTVFLDTLPYERYDPTEVGTLAIIGDCEALYYSNGDTVDTWVSVEYGDSDWRRDYVVTPTDELAVGYEIELVRLSESSSFDEDAYWFSLVLRVDDIRPDDDEIEYTLTMADTFGEIPADELLMSLSDPSELSITFDANRRTLLRREERSQHPLRPLRHGPAVRRSGTRHLMASSRRLRRHVVRDAVARHAMV